MFFEEISAEKVLSAERRHDDSLAASKDALNYDLINESLELASLAKRLYATLQKKGLQVGLSYDNKKISSFLQKWDGNTLSYKQGKAERTKEDTTGKRDDATIFCDIRKDDESWSKLGIRFRPINNSQESSFVGDFISGLKDFMNSTPKDKSGKPLDKSLSESLTIECPFGWKLDEFETKINEIIKRNGNFYTLEPLVIIKPKFVRKKHQEEYSRKANAYMGLKRTKTENGISHLIGSGFEYSSDKYEKNSELSLIKIDDNKKIVEISRGMGQVEDSPKIQKLTNIAKKFAKENKYKYVQWFYPRLEIDENGKLNQIDKPKQETK
jgi:hypothetical protein